jgi:hypothetical protein
MDVDLKIRLLESLADIEQLINQEAAVIGCSAHDLTDSVHDLMRFLLRQPNSKEGRVRRLIK